MADFYNDEAFHKEESIIMGVIYNIIIATSSTPDSGNKTIRISYDFHEEPTTTDLEGFRYKYYVTEFAVCDVPAIVRRV